MTITTNRRNFAAVLNRARRERTLTSYARNYYCMGRMLTLANGESLLYRHPSWEMRDPCERDERVKGDDDGREYADPGDHMKGWE
jgi:hypothetical protein